MKLKNILICFSVVVLFAGILCAQEKTAVLKLCTTKNGVPFPLTTENKETAEKLGFKKYKETPIFVRDFRIMVDNVPNSFFKPLNENCITVYKIEPGRKTVLLDFKAASYTTIESKSPFTTTFKSDLLYNTTIEVVDGSTATVKIDQHSNNISLFQSLDNKEVPNCEKECMVPIGIPIYFVIKAQDEKVKCPIQFELIVNDQRDKKLDCYKSSAIQKMLAEHVEKNNIMCRINLEYAFFKVFGDGCIVSIEADKDGLNYEMPEIRLFPLDKQKFKYFWKTNSGDKKPYEFSGNRKGPEKTPSENEIIEIIEERNN